MDLSVKSIPMCNNANMNMSSKINFKGELSDAQVNKALNMLKDKISGIQACPDMNGLNNIIKNLMNKYSMPVGIMVIPEPNLEGFLGKEASKYNLKDLVGLCIAVGDKTGPVESWSKAYETIVALLPKSSLR